MTPPRSVIVIGVGGGVGATTATAMIAAGLAAATGSVPSLSDRTGGSLASRAPAHLASLRRDDSVRIHDLGHHVTDPALTDLLAAGAVAIVATAASAPAEKQGAERALRLMANGAGSSAPLIVATQVFGRETSVPAARNAQFRVHAIPWDRSLAAGGRIYPDTIESATTEAFDRLVFAVRRSLGLVSGGDALP